MDTQKNTSINDNYIIWPLITALILFGIPLIVRQFVIQAGGGAVKEREVFIKNTLPESPEIIKAVYFTSTTAGSKKSIDLLIGLSKRSELNAVVIDIKDFSGYVAYDSGIPEVKKYKAERIDIQDINGLIKKLHDNNIYVIARITVFQDPVLARARPDWAVRNKYTGGLWYDRNGLAWINPAATASWDYYIDISRDAARRGFDELNFDYIRFPSDGDMSALVFPGWPARRSFSEGGDGTKSKADIIGEFYSYLRRKLPDIKLSADLFGFVTTHTDDLGIGQIMENAFASFDFISPMVYPSHYPPTYLGFQNPAVHPYEVVYTSMKGGMERLEKFKSLNSLNKAEFRPWLQDFNLGADYTQAMVEAEIKATKDALGENYKGFMLWNSRNIYHESVFQ